MKANAYLAAICLCAFLKQPVSAASQFIPIGGAATDGIVSIASALSADGSTVVGLVRIPVDDPAGPKHDEAFRWTQAAGMSLIRMQPSGNYLSTTATGVSNDGSVIVGNEFNSDGGEAFRWNASDGISGLGFLSPTSPDVPSRSLSVAVSGDGSVVFGSSGPSTDVGQPFRWSSSDAMQPFATNVAAISPDGAVVVGERATPGRFEATRWTQQTGELGLGDLQNGADYSKALGVSADGKVVVGLGIVNNYQAFRWTQESGIQSLGTLPGTDASWANVLSANGDLVFRTSTAGGRSNAFVWDPIHGLRELSQVLKDKFALGPALKGWNIYQVAGISTDGLSVAGIGTNPDGNIEAWIVRLDRPIGVPEPSSLAIAFIAAVVLVIPRIARRNH